MCLQNLERRVQKHDCSVSAHFKGCGLRHLAFRVDDVEAAVAELAQMGIECEPIRLDSYTKKKMTFFFDPDGLPLELHE